MLSAHVLPLRKLGIVSEVPGVIHICTFDMDMDFRSLMGSNLLRKSRCQDVSGCALVEST